MKANIQTPEAGESVFLGPLFFHTESNLYVPISAWGIGRYTEFENGK